MGKIDIRAITHSDHHAVHEVYRRCMDSPAPGPAAEASIDMAVADIEEAKAESRIYCGIFHGKKMIGVVSYVPSRFEFRPVDAFILLLMIIPPYRRKGIGGEVIGHIEKEICAKGRVKAIIGTLHVNNPDAIRFWQKHGYKVVGGPEVSPGKSTVYRLRKEIQQ